MKERKIARFCAYVGTAVVIAALAAAIMAGSGYQAGLWQYRTGFVILRWAVYVAAGAAIVALVGGLLAAWAKRARLAIVGFAGVLVALALIVPSWRLQQTAGMVPRIHDITTDTANPPQFVALLPVRRKTANGPEYDGEKVARQQKAGYPDIQPVVVDEPPAQAFDRALAAARRLKWEIIASVPAEGRIEATDTTRWFRFKDDIVIRVTANGPGARIDIRSKSRIGRSDLGTNARRIRRFFAALKEAGPGAD
jgi:uncharacterized protein (DUF1499 family)